MIDELNINISNQFLDGSKLEANANKYKFVFKPTIYHKKLDIKIKILLNEININFSSDDLIKSFQLKEIICKYIKEQNIDINSIPAGRGKRLTKS